MGPWRVKWVIANKWKIHCWMEWKQGFLNVYNWIHSWIHVDLYQDEWSWSRIRGFWNEVYCIYSRIDEWIRKFHCELVEMWMEWTFHTAENCRIHEFMHTYALQKAASWKRVRMQMHSVQNPEFTELSPQMGEITGMKHSWTDESIIPLLDSFTSQFGSRRIDKCRNHCLRMEMSGGK